MARYTGAVCRICRRESTKLFLKGDRCYSSKCSYDRRPQAPGQHGTRRSKASEYGIQLREKQKVKRNYGLMEKQFHSTFVKAERQQGITGANLLVLLERRFDNVIFRLGFSVSRNQARQLIRHGHFLVNDHKVDIPSYVMNEGDKITLREKSKKIPMFQAALEDVARRGVPEWLEIDATVLAGTIKNIPAREDLTMPINEQLIVELYSK